MDNIDEDLLRELMKETSTHLYSVYNKNIYPALNEFRETLLFVCLLCHYLKLPYHLELKYDSYLFVLERDILEVLAEIDRVDTLLGQISDSVGFIYNVMAGLVLDNGEQS